jgi:hypothetical protein
VVVVGELVDSVYRLDGWEASGPVASLATTGAADTGAADTGAADTGAATPGAAGGGAPERYSFVGVRDPELERRYVGKSVAAYLGRGSPNAVAYVWSGPHWVNTAP